jgi:hypothetical protein
VKDSGNTSDLELIRFDGDGTYLWIFGSLDLWIFGQDCHLTILDENEADHAMDHAMI